MKLVATKFDSMNGKTYCTEYEIQQEKTLRDEFAMAALTGLLFQYSTRYNHSAAVEEAYQIADSMLKAREQ